jgi:hypothetical protein
VVPVTLPWEDIEVAVQTGELDGIAWSGITEDYTVGWANVTNYFLTNNISGAWVGSYFANTDELGRGARAPQDPVQALHGQLALLPPALVLGGEAHYRTTGGQAELTSIPEDEWATVEAEALKFWDEIAKTSPRAPRWWRSSRTTTRPWRRPARPTATPDFDAGGSPAWVVEMAQFMMAAYYLLGGGYSMQLDAMCAWTCSTAAGRRAPGDGRCLTTAFFLIFYLVVLLYGGFSSTEYALEYNRRTTPPGRRRWRRSRSS